MAVNEQAIPGEPPDGEASEPLAPDEHAADHAAMRQVREHWRDPEEKATLRELGELRGLVYAKVAELDAKWSRRGAIALVIAWALLLGFFLGRGPRRDG